MREIPSSAEWTDHNSSDPGIKVLELLAYAAEALVGVALIVAWWRWARRRRGTCDV